MKFYKQEDVLKILEEYIKQAERYRISNVGTINERYEAQLEGFMQFKDDLLNLSTVKASEQLIFVVNNS